MKHIQTFESFLNESESQDVQITPATFNKDKEMLSKAISKVLRGTGLAPAAKDAIFTQMAYGKDSKIESVRLTPNEIYVVLKSGTIYDTANLEIKQALDDIKYSDNVNVIAGLLIKKWTVTAMTTDGTLVDLVWQSKSNHKYHGASKGLNLYDVQMKNDKGSDFSTIGNASNEREMIRVLNSTNMFAR
jgi:hypothetical protein